MYTTVVILRTIIYSAVARGASLDKLCESVGLTQPQLHDNFRKVEGAEGSCRIWEAVIQETKDETIGVHLGSQNQGPILGLIMYVIQNCPTLKDAWEVLQKNQLVLSDWVTYDLEVKANEVHLYWIVNPLWIKSSPATSWQAAELGLGNFMSSVPILLGKEITPRYVELMRPSSSTPEEYEKVFKCPVKFGSNYNKIVLQKDWFATPIISFDKSLYAVFSKMLEEKATEMVGGIKFHEEVKRCLLTEFKGQVPPIDVIASFLNHSNRSFQRRLEAEGTTYRAISEEVKKELTLALLKNPKHNVKEISKALGYTEPTAFRMAFKRWTNQSPAQWRKNYEGKR